VHFLENHDEPRAVAMPLDLHRAAVVLSLSLPGMRFLHHAQMDGARRFARIQLRRRATEAIDMAILAMYTNVLDALGESSVGQGEAQLLVPQPAWDGNPTAGCFVIVKWRDDLVVVNLAPHRAQCRVVVPGLERHTWRLTDRLGDEHWTRTGDEPVFFDLPPRGAQLFALQRTT
jgi:hypothetical protein